MKIRVHTQVLKTKSGDIDKNLDDFANAILNVRNVASEMGNHWQGADFRAFNAKIDSFIKDLNRLEKSMETYSEFLKQYNNSIIDNDNNYKKKTINLR